MNLRNLSAIREMGDTMRHRFPLQGATFHLYIRKAGWYKNPAGDVENLRMVSEKPGQRG
jgi:hypothetical protein